MGSHFMSFSFFPAWHNIFIKVNLISMIYFLTLVLTLFTKVFAGLNEGM